MECAWITLALVVLFLAATIHNRIRFRGVAATRAGENFNTFRAAFEGEPIPECVLQTVYRELQPYCAGVVDFPIRPEDDLMKVYGVEDVCADIVEIVIRECGYRLPELAKGEPTTVLVTVRDLVHAIANCPKA